LASRLEGIDLSPRMMEKAADRGIYDALLVGDLVEALCRRPGCYDLIVAGDVFVYLGDLTAAFQAAAGALKPGGALAFSVERSDGGIVLGPGLRYAHGRDSLDAAAAAAGLRTILLRPESTRTEAGQPVPGWVGVMRR
jgi:predicted TPR repeat methyltransferase